MLTLLMTGRVFALDVMDLLDLLDLMALFGHIWFDCPNKTVLCLVYKPD